MEIVIDYRKRAKEGRDLARQMSLNEHRDRLIDMAKDWERLAQERENKLSKHSSSPSPDASDIR